MYSGVLVESEIRASERRRIETLHLGICALALGFQCQRLRAQEDCTPRSSPTPNRRPGPRQCALPSRSCRFRWHLQSPQTPFETVNPNSLGFGVSGFWKWKLDESKAEAFQVAALNPKPPSRTSFATLTRKPKTLTPKPRTVLKPKP